MPQYFRNFPTTIYDNKIVRDITRVARVQETKTASPNIFYPYTIKHQMRSDLISEYYYDDPYNDWLIYTSNEIVDPYYQWYLDFDTLNSLVIQKYGSLEIAKRKVKYYQNNWSDDDQELTPSFYNNNLANSWKKYYNPVFGVNLKIISYKRKEDDTKTNTNRILEFTISDNANVAYIHNEVVNVRATGTDTTVGKGQVDFANSTILRLNSVSGDLNANTTDLKDMIGDESGANTTANSVQVTFENFSNSEAVFWSEVTYYDYEVLQNELKKDLKLVGDGVAPLLIEEFRKKISEDIENT